MKKMNTMPKKLNSLKKISKVGCQKCQVSSPVHSLQKLCVLVFICMIIVLRKFIGSMFALKDASGGLGGQSVCALHQNQGPMPAKATRVVQIIPNFKDGHIVYANKYNSEEGGCQDLW